MEKINKKNIFNQEIRTYKLKNTLNLNSIKNIINYYSSILYEL